MTQTPAVVQPSGPIHPTQEQLAKLRSELDIVQGNVTVMSEMLTEMNPGQEESGDLELLQVRYLRYYRFQGLSFETRNRPLSWFRHLGLKMRLGRKTRAFVDL